MGCVVIGRWVALTLLAGPPPLCPPPLRLRVGGHSLSSGAHSDTYIVLHKSWRGVKMPVKVHAAHVHFMLERPALRAKDERAY